VKAVFRFVPDQVTLHEVARAAADQVGEAGSDGDAAGPATGAASGAISRTLRIDAARIDRLVDLVGEMAVAKNALAHLADQVGDGLDRKDLSQGLLTSQAAMIVL
jgi:two-component system chemotaxis sensor kinase CheA